MFNEIFFKFVKKTLKSSIIFTYLPYFIDNFNSTQTVFFIDRVVKQLYADKFDKFSFFVEIEASEEKKSLSMVEHYLFELKKQYISRDFLLVGVGGGITTDITGFVASIYMRGMRFGFVPTTLLGMVDAAIGGKNGVNAFGIKNMIGTIRQPEWIVIDVTFLNTLSDEHYRQGLAEVVKHAIIDGEEYFAYLEEHHHAIVHRSLSHVQTVIEKSVQVKTRIIELDEEDQHFRHVLNMGHTMAHVLEAVTGLPHGHCVAIGLMMESRIANQLGICTAQFIDRLQSLLNSLGLPSSTDVHMEDIEHFMKMDKKIRSQALHLFFPVTPGQYVDRYVSVDEFLRLLKQAGYG